MKLFRTQLTTLCALVCVACIALPVAALAASITKPKLFKTSASQAEQYMDVGTYFHITKTDSAYPWKAKICAVGHCQTFHGSGLGTDAQATEYTPNFAIKKNELHKLIKVKTTLTIDGKSWTYKSSAKDVKSLCGGPRLTGSPKAPAC